MTFVVFYRRAIKSYLSISYHIIEVFIDCLYGILI